MCKSHKHEKKQKEFLSLYFVAWPILNSVDDVLLVERVMSKSYEAINMDVTNVHTT